MDGYAGFNQLEAGWGGHQKALAWYLLTSKVNAYGVPRFERPGASVVDATRAHRRLGDLVAAGIPLSEVQKKTWYTPDHLLALKDGEPLHGHPDVTWEGIGTSFYTNGYEHCFWVDILTAPSGAVRMSTKQYRRNLGGQTQLPG